MSVSSSSLGDLNNEERNYNSCTCQFNSEQPIAGGGRDGEVEAY